MLDNHRRLVISGRVRDIDSKLNLIGIILLSTMTEKYLFIDHLNQGI